MAVLVVADVHSNWQALQAVFADAVVRATVDAVWCLGDIVGYGPQPAECIAALRDRDARCIAGNHDLAVTGRAPLSAFNDLAAEACRWTRGVLRAGDLAYLGALPVGEDRVDPFLLVHASPRDPVWEYVASEDTAAACFHEFAGVACLVGHSHHPLVFVQNPAGAVTGRRLRPGETTRVGGARRLIYNPGSVGQPRDGDPRAAYAIYDPAHATLRHFRVDYDIGETQRRIARAGLPQPLSDRLAVGR